MPLLLLLSCSDFNLFGEEGEPGSAGPALDPVDTPPVCAVEGASGGELDRLATCTAVDVEWGAGLRLFGSVEVPLYAMGILPPSEANRLVFLDNDRGDSFEEWTTLVDGDVEQLATGQFPGGHSGLATVQINGRNAIVSAVESEEGVAIELTWADDWTSALLAEHRPGTHLTVSVADIRADGTPEAILDVVAAGLDAAYTRALPELGDRARFGSRSGTAPGFADLDGDGGLELMLPTGIYDWAAETAAGWGATESVGGANYAVLGDADAQPVIAVRTNDLHLAGPDGAYRWKYEIVAPQVSKSLAAGDIDGDGLPEICVQGKDRLHVIDLDGNLRWEVAVEGADGYGGVCSMADLDGDGRYELVVWGPDGLLVYDGDGKELARATDGIAFGDLTELGPIILDLDGDGSAEIVVVGAPHGTGPPGFLYIYTAAEGSFARTRPVWHQRSYDVTSVADDGTIVRDPIPNWQSYNSFRAQPAHDGERPDLVPVFVDACASGCDGEGIVLVSVQVENQGSAPAVDGTVVALYTDHGGAMSRVGSTTLSAALPALTRSDSVTIEVPAALLGSRQLLQVDNVQPGVECIHTNDRVYVELGVCAE